MRNDLMIVPGDDSGGVNRSWLHVVVVLVFLPCIYRAGYITVSVPCITDGMYLVFDYT